MVCCSVHLCILNDGGLKINMLLNMLIILLICSLELGTVTLLYFLIRE